MERYGFGPEFIVDYKALKGDPSDNIIGVKGIGEKSATELIKKYGRIENIFAKLKEDKIEAKPRIIELLKNGEEEAQFSKTLAEIRRDAPIDFSLEKISWKDGFDKEKIRPIFNELGFKSLIDRLNGENKKKNEEASLAGGQAEKRSKQRNKKKNGNGCFRSSYGNSRKTIGKILTEMEKTGALLDVGYLKNLSEEKHRELENLEKKSGNWQAGNSTSIHPSKWGRFCL